MGEKKARLANKALRTQQRWKHRALLAAAAIAAAAIAIGGHRWYRDRFPLEQRCPPPEDRFHEHCQVSPLPAGLLPSVHDVSDEHALAVRRRDGCTTRFSWIGAAWARSALR